MYKYIISSLIAFVMVASLMLFWSPLTESAVALEDECPPLAICACAGKWTGNMRIVPCDCACDCDTPDPYNIVCQAHHCSRKEIPLVLQPYPYTSVDGDGVICAVQDCGIVCDATD